MENLAKAAFLTPETERLFELCEGCSATICRLKIDARDPLEAAALAKEGPWCPGHCAAFVREVGRIRQGVLPTHIG